MCPDNGVSEGGAGKGGGGGSACHCPKVRRDAGVCRWFVLYFFLFLS